MNYEDNTYNYRQDSSFLYFWGLSYAGLAAVIDIDEGREIIFGDELTIDHIVWMGTQPTLHEKAQRVGVTETLPLAELKKYVEKVVAQKRTLSGRASPEADGLVRGEAGSRDAFCSVYHRSCESAEL